MRAEPTFAAKSRYVRIGGEPTIRRLVARFYEVMETLPAAAKVRAMHEDIASARNKMELFLIQWLGGPQTYTEKFGYPSLRMRHSRFSISAAERDAWVKCMSIALSELEVDSELRHGLERDLGMVATALVNTR